MVAYIARHKLWKREALFTAWGPVEFKYLINVINPLVKGEEKHPTDLRRQIFEEMPHLGMDNHFSGNATLAYVGNKGFKSTVACQP